MKRAFFLAGVSLVLAAAGACASSEDEATPPGPDRDSGSTAPMDGAAAEAAPDAFVVSGCSAAGWCVTPLPDSDLTIKDVWPFSGRAFAVAESPTVGVKVLEWKDADAKWKYIDDNTQNEAGRGKYVGKMWSPSDSEIYFGVSPRTIYHGTKRQDGGLETWSWTHQQLEDKVPAYDASEHGDHYSGRPSYSALEMALPSLGVFGTSADDVYAWYANAIYHWKSADGGSPTWVAEYVATDRDDNAEQLFFLGATAASRDDVWFAGGRGGDPAAWAACAIVVRKTSAGYRRVADGVIRFPDYCAEKPGTLMIGGAEGWVTDIHTTAANRYVGLKGGRDVAQISVTSEGGADRYSVALSPIPGPVSRRNLISLWTAPNEPLWLGGFNVVLRGGDVWDGGSFEISTLALNGAWLTLPVHQIRGSSNVDHWAVGARHALHKTTP